MSGGVAFSHDVLNFMDLHAVEVGLLDSIFTCLGKKLDVFLNLYIKKIRLKGSCGCKYFVPAVVKARGFTLPVIGISEERVFYLSIFRGTVGVPPSRSKLYNGWPGEYTVITWFSFHTGSQAIGRQGTHSALIFALRD